MLTGVGNVLSWRACSVEAPAAGSAMGRTTLTQNVWLRTLQPGFMQTRVPSTEAARSAKTADIGTALQAVKAMKTSNGVAHTQRGGDPA
ncbi:MAG UNVERIFIED_CONTAM: hypothetical protein LVR18_50210 [Planctomycetaceae bacterium]